MAYDIAMSWDANDVALLKKLWADGHSAGQIANRLGASRNAVSAKLKRLGHKRGHKPPTASPKIVSMPARREQAAAACARSVDRVVSKPKPPKAKAARSSAANSRSGAMAGTGLTKHELYAMLADAVRNTGRR
jgi:GcrA cell cycle regulator